jgi:Sulfotransferase domain
MEGPNMSAIDSAPAHLRKHLPDFLIISPPKTGSTWLAFNLQCHPDVFMPDIKELKYFSLYHRWLGLDWYAAHFHAAGARLKGEASPSYALLPGAMIRRLHALVPRVKLVFLMRDPVARAWSHARHNCRYREANFENYQGDPKTVPDEAWRANFRHPWPLASGDYLGQLQRWLAVFPREQIYVDLYERLRTDPAGLVLNVLKFLGARTNDLDWSSFRLQETILPGIDRALSGDLRRELQQLLHDRTHQLDGFLRERFGLDVWGAWEDSFGADIAFTSEAAPLAGTPAPSPGEVFARALDDEYLAGVLESEVQASNPQLLQEGYHGHNLVLHHGRVLAFAQALGARQRTDLDAAAARSHDGAGIFVGDSLTQVKEKVADHAIRDLEQRLTLLQTKHEVLEHELADCVAFVSRIRNSRAFRARRAVGQWLTNRIARIRKDAGTAVPPLAPALPGKPP